jgi:tyrosine-protein phosphatase SIW14
LDASAQSPRLSSRPRLRPVVVGLLVAAALVAGYFGLWRYHLKRFQAVREGILYRSAQPTEFGLQYLTRQRGVKTVLSLQLFDPQLSHGLIDLGRRSGARESDYVTTATGAHLVQWPMGLESCWPWMTPWQFEEFFRLFDNSENLPVAVHCMGGRHRTGTISALFRLEYDRWPVERALTEMYSFNFGEGTPMQEYNLRTYLPRPHPDDADWQVLREAFAPLAAGDAPADYEALVRRLRASASDAKSRQAASAYVAARQPFALPLAVRLIDTVDDPLVKPATELASQRLEESHAAASDWQMAAALIADFGTPRQQARLLQMIEHESREAKVSPHYAALVAGVSNRYTENRLAYLQPVLEDERLHFEPGAQACRYCYVAMVRMAAITDQRWIIGFPERPHWDHARNKARQWLASHPDEVRLARLKLPSGNNTVIASEERHDEDLSRLPH